METIFYGLFDKTTDEIFYIGKTNNLRLRKNRHKYNYRKGVKFKLYEYMRSIGGWENVGIEVIDVVTIEDNELLLNLEREFMLYYNTLGKGNDSDNMTVMHSKKVKVVNLTTNEERVFDSVTELENTSESLFGYKLANQTISNVANGGYYSKKGVWKNRKDGHVYKELEITYI